MNPNATRVVNAWLEPALADTPAEDNVQFERLGYFVAGWHDHSMPRRCSTER